MVMDDDTILSPIFLGCMQVSMKYNPKLLSR